MPFWDYIHVGRERQQHHNLQEGLLQIASQTCSILVQVNNTNNISYGNNSTNVQYSNFSSDFCNSAGCSSNRANYESRNNNNNSNNNNSRRNNDNSEQTAVLIPQSSSSSSSSSTTTTTTGFRRSSTVAAKNLFTHYKHRLSTVLEGNTPAGGGDDDFELWDQNQMLRSEQHHVQKWGHGSWCKPSCIPISVILTLIILVVLLPLLEHHNDKPSANAKGIKTPYVCTDSCSIQLVESIPEGLVYPTDSPTFLSTYDAWNKLLDIANHSIDVGSFYWTMRQDDIYNHSSSWQGEKIFQKFLNIGVRTNVKIRIAQNAPTQDQPNIDTEILIKRKAAEVRSVNFPRLIGAGVLHTKLWIIDKLHMYVGSANMDWRSLTQVKELGVLIMNCSCLVNDVSKIFNVYWDMGRNDSRIPTYWPIEYSTNYNVTNPIKINFNNNASDFYTYLSSSPPQMSPKGRAQDIDAILSVIDEAEKFIYISVMDYFPLMLYSPKTKFWPTIDNALRAAAIEHKVTVKMLISWWNHSRSSEDYFLRSLTALSNSYKGVDIEIKRFVVPSTPDQSKIPFGRVNHNKYMVTDNTAYIGTSNWSGDYFVNTAGIGLILQDSQHEFNLLNNRTTTNGNTTIRDDLVKLFERDWQSIYALDLMQ